MIESKIIERAWRYVARMESAVSGSNGRAATFKVGLALKKGFDLSDEEALPLFQKWNTGCMPPWTDKELAAALKDAGKANKPAGYLLGDSRPNPHVDEAEIRRRKRQSWLSMRPITEDDAGRIASLRCVSTGAVELLRGNKFLWRTRWRDNDVFVIRNGPSGTFAQMRR
ncbi:MAG: hypothetical protein EOO38_23750, partial [Cytophagaceae bacterium]